MFSIINEKANMYAVSTKKLLAKIVCVIELYLREQIRQDYFYKTDWQTSPLCGQFFGPLLAR